MCKPSTMDYRASCNALVTSLKLSDHAIHKSGWWNMAKRLVCSRIQNSVSKPSQPLLAVQAGRWNCQERLKRQPGIPGLAGQYPSQPIYETTYISTTRSTKTTKGARVCYGQKAQTTGRTDSTCTSTGCTDDRAGTRIGSGLWLQGCIPNQ